MTPHDCIAGRRRKEVVRTMPPPSVKTLQPMCMRRIKRDIDQPSFGELFAPVHQAVRDNNIPDAELDSVLQDAIGWIQRRERRASTA